jgi:hypothetical protein
MKPNPALKKLGFSNDDRVLILHADDIGMCHASVQAYLDLIESGFISSGATMVPCSWFPLVASLCRQSSKADMGVHLTLTSEWDLYRWAPISTHDKNSGLIDSQGYFHRSTEDAQNFGQVDAVKIELSEQVNRCLNSGMSITHLDTHMNSVAHPKFIAEYIWLAVSHKLPFLFPRLDETGFVKLGLTQEIAIIAAANAARLEEQGIPLVDCVSGLYLDDAKNRMDQAKKILSTLPSGITHFIIHPSIDTLELRSITPDWPCRVADYQTFMDRNLQNFITDLGFHIIGYQDLKNIIP